MISKICGGKFGTLDEKEWKSTVTNFIKARRMQQLGHLGNNENNDEVTIITDEMGRDIDHMNCGRRYETK